MTDSLALPPHLIFLAIGSIGDVRPLHLIARELHRRGHAVTLVALPGFEKTQDDGFELVTAPQDLAPELAKSKDVASWWAKTWIGRGFASWRAATPLVLRRTRWVQGFLRQRRSQARLVVLARSGLLGARIARECADLFLITVHHTPAAFRSRYESFVLPVPQGMNRVLRFARSMLWQSMDIYVGALLRRPLNQYRRELALPPIWRLFDKWVFSPDMNLALFPEWYASPQPDWPANTWLAGFPLSDDKVGDSLPDDVQDFLRNGAPVVVFTRGSHSASGEEFFRIAAAVCLAQGWRGLILGPARESAQQRRNAFVLQVPFASLAAVLPSASVLVHHGGIGTCALALRAGVPQIIIPGVGDQWDQAKRVVRLGCGSYLPLRSLNQARLASAMTSLLKNEVMQARCTQVANDCRSDGVSQAASLIEFVGQLTAGQQETPACEVEATIKAVRDGNERCAVAAEVVEV